MKTNRRTSSRDIELTDLDLFDLEETGLPAVRNAPAARKASGKLRKPTHKPASAVEKVDAVLMEQADDVSTFDFSYHATRHERQWITDSLGHFYEAQWIDDVLRLVKGGKEANVYQCAAPRKFRNLKNDHVYRQGRTDLDSDGRAITDDGALHAIRKRTQYGLELTHTSWIEYEFQTLEILHKAGADSPRPYARGNNAILMEYIGDRDVAAPTLNSVHLERDEAQPLFERVMRNVEIMLANARVHGDLSAYNILYWEGQITLIDFPQVIQPEINTSAYNIFERDIRRVCEYFARYGVQARPRQIAADMWTAYRYRLTPEIHPRLLNDQDDQDLAYWRRLTGG
jgi:RIO kinase 1